MRFLFVSLNCLRNCVKILPCTVLASYAKYYGIYDHNHAATSTKEINFDHTFAYRDAMITGHEIADQATSHD
ncbi:hypothetical protein KIN20_021539 [Parelaphostrongylus tenuis]|uniref:Uncharacterized protein n=1 Tax=Parelaphostrongylus tenuis TaxID=148309 RepID=A0AAD5NAY6_PARTN|nr:hypothetical protein KIN20_021539 [Parelaphostrongylus tenuis]